MTGVITWTFDCGDGVCIEREQPSTALKPMTHFTTFDSFSSPDVYHPEFQPEPNGFESPHGTYFAGHDPLTGLDTGSGNDRFMGLDTGSGDDRLTGAGSTGFFGDEIHGQWSFFGDEIHFIHNLGGTAGPGGTTFFTENISGTAGPGGTSFFTENVGGSAGPGGTSYFTNFAMPVGDFI